MSPHDGNSGKADALSAGRCLSGTMRVKSRGSAAYLAPSLSEVNSLTDYSIIFFGTLFGKDTPT